MNAFSPIQPADVAGQVDRIWAVAGGEVSEARLINELRRAERDWSRFAQGDTAPGGNPWAEYRDEAAARHARIRADLTAAQQLRKEMSRG